jgi:glycosyltransferase involved in cell wall biosynthesis
MTTSAIISAYIEEQIIESTIGSISEFLVKTFNEGEIIIVNDGSTDSTQTVLKKLIVKNNEKNNLSVSALFSFVEIAELRDDASCWVNQCATRYYEVESILAVEK